MNGSLNKSLVTNIVCALVVVIGYLLPEPFRRPVLGMGFFGLSGAVTNWLAVHMLFERVPGLYGSGIIPLKFEAFKAAIHSMIMEQFFTKENIEKFMHGEAGATPNLQPVIDNLNYDMIFDGFVEIVKNSRLGGMLTMFGGASALEPMREPFARTLRAKLTEMLEDPDFFDKLSDATSMPIHDIMEEKIDHIVQKRLNELTPQMVKEIIQNMIRSHLGWLVVWGGVFGGLIGLLSSFAMG